MSTRNEALPPNRSVEPLSVTSLRVRCPGHAHRTGGDCLICDPENDGFIEILLTEPERDVLVQSARGLPFDAALARRLVRYGLLIETYGIFLPSAEGYSLIADRLSRHD